ncbi:Kelch repeat-containing protein [Brevibacillus reuszeri]|uniref:Kelch repeat-containing protein n=1 Tax=Brevibacillus reuszeri TaxID=54915 RepID=UPI001BB44618|nr:kelch-like protein [Brevibacillus reuszeri]
MAEVENSEPLEPPVVSWIPEETAGGDTWINKGEYAAGFSVKVTSTKPSTVYVVPSGTPRDRAQIEQIAIASAVIPSAGEAVTISFVSEDTRITDGEAYILFAIDDKGGVSLPSANVFSVDLETPTIDQASIEDSGWQGGAEMNDSRYGGASVVLADGDVLVVGGGMVKSGERYDVRRDKWIAIADMSEVRYGPGAALLPDGKVLVVGGDPSGNPNNLLKSTEIYDPEQDSWEQASDMSVERFKSVAVALEDGRVLVSGGFSKKGYLKSTEIYDPETDEWTRAADMKIAREGMAATLLNDGRVLVVGGTSVDYLDSAEVYDPDADEWTLVSSMPEKRYKPVAVTLVEGKVLVAGGHRLQSAVLYDPKKDSWEETQSLPAKNVEAMAARLPDGSVVLAGGVDSQPLASTLIYHPHLSIDLLFQKDVALQRDLDDLSEMLAYSIDGGQDQALRKADRVSFTGNRLNIVLDVLPKGTSIQFKLQAGAVVDAAGNPNEELITDSYSYAR